MIWKTFIVLPLCGLITAAAADKCLVHVFYNKPPDSCGDLNQSNDQYEAGTLFKCHNLKTGAVEVAADNIPQSFRDGAVQLWAYNSPNCVGTGQALNFQTDTFNCLYDSNGFASFTIGT